MGRGGLEMRRGGLRARRGTPRRYKGNQMESRCFRRFHNTIFFEDAL